jgi:hypothetical protein
LATNRPSYLTVVRDVFANRRLRPLARIRHALLDPDVRRPALTQDSGFAPIYMMSADRDSATAGKAILIAGHGMFTNGMLLQPHTDNLAFAFDGLRWLGAGAEQRRRHALLLVDGEPVTSFDTSLTPPLPAVPIPTVEVVNQLLRGVEKEGILFRILAEALNVQVAVRWALLVLTAGLLFYGAKRITEQRHPVEKGTVLLVGPYAVRADRSPLVHQRYRAQVASNALGDEARAMVRTWFAQVCGISPADWEHVASDRALQPEVAGGWWQRYRMRREAQWLARLAAGPITAAFSWRDLVRLTKRLQDLNVAIQEGRLAFAPAPVAPAPVAPAPVAPAPVARDTRA